MRTKVWEGRMRGIKFDYVTIWYNDGTHEELKEPGSLRFFPVIKEGISFSLISLDDFVDVPTFGSH